MWIHINKFGVNECFDSADVRCIGFVKDGSQNALEIIYKDNSESRLIVSEQLKESSSKCHELMRDIAKALQAAAIVGPNLQLPK